MTKRLVVGSLSVAAVLFGQDATPAEREKAARYLVETRKGVEDAVKGLTEAQWKYKAAPDRWSIAEVVEHLAVTEDFVKTFLAKLPDGPPPAADKNAAKFDEELMVKVLDRTKKFEAPPPIRPAARWTPEEALQHFLTSRAQTAEELRTKTALRAHTVPHPVLGALDGYEWILIVAGHSARHTQQILEVKADAGFPAVRSSAAPAPDLPR
jgi:hypothetical protein